MRLFALLTILIVVTVGCQSDLEVVETTDPKGYVERYTIRKDNGAKEGWYVKSAPNTTILEETQFKDNMAHGFRILYYPNGDTMSVSTFERGVLNGTQTKYYPAGGTEEIATYTNGSKTGPFKEFWKDGVLRTEGFYADGLENGEIKNYDQLGNHYRTLNCYQSVCTTEWLHPDYEKN